MSKEVQKNCKCAYRIKHTFGANWKVKFEDRWLATFDSYTDARNFIDDHINHVYEESIAWTKVEDKPIKVQVVK